MSDRAGDDDDGDDDLDADVFVEMDEDAGGGADETLGERDAGEDTELLSPPPRAWLLGTVFARRFLSSLVAEGGTGKTAVRYAQLLSLATGRELTGEHVFQRCRVLIVSLEDDIHELRRRILAVMLHYGIEQHELSGWLFLSAPGAAGGKLMATDKKGRATRGDLADKLEATIVKRKIDLACLDPFIKTHSVEENNNSAIDDVVQILTDLGVKYDLAIDTPHHARKGPADPGNAANGRGASSQKDAGRLVYTLTVMTLEDAKLLGVPEEQRRSLLRMENAKVNIARPATKAVWFRLVNVSLGNRTELYPNGDQVQTVERWIPPECWEGMDDETKGAILKVIGDGLPDGRRYSGAAQAKAPRAAWCLITEHMPEKNEAQARAIIAAWLSPKVKVLVDRTYRDPVVRRDANGLFVVPEKQAPEDPK